MFALLWSLAGCTSFPEQEATWMQGAYFNWDLFNHRVSYIHLGVGDDEVEASIVGGTSTTNTPADLDEGCDSGCSEFPFVDDADVRVGWSRVTTSDVALGTVRAELVVGAEGGSTTVEVPLPEGARRGATAVLRGVVFDADHPLDGEEACYRPEYGWHPRRIAVSIDEVTLEDGVASVTVSAAFNAGATEDPTRQCIDEVYERALIPVTADVLVIAGFPSRALDEATVASAMTYPFDGGTPDKQEEAPPLALGIDTEGAIVGWRAIDFAFNTVENPGDRGAYLRSWGFEITGDSAAGIATNYSPGTQLHEMDYVFDGTVVAVEAEGTYETGTVVETIDVELEDERPVVFTFPLE